MPAGSISLSPTTGFTGGVIGDEFSQTLTVASTSGISAPYTLTISAGALPPGLSLTTGVLSGSTSIIDGTFTTAGGISTAKKLFVGTDLSVGGNVTAGVWQGTAITVPYGGTGATTVAAALTNLGAAPISSPIFTDIPQAPTAVVGTNTTQIATTAFVKSSIRLNSDEFTATLNQTVFTFTTGSSNTGAVQTPLTKPFMYINGTRIKNTAYTWTSGNTYVTYVPANNNSYTLVAGDRVQFDYAY